MKKFIVTTVFTFGFAALLPAGCLPDLNGASNAPSAPTRVVVPS